MSRVLVVPDIHAPFQHPRTIEFLKAVYAHYELDTVVCLGDEIDFHGLSKYPKDPDGFSAGIELSYAIDFMKRFYEAFPVVRVCTSNHTSRPFRKAYEYGVPEGLIREYKDFLKAPDSWMWSDEWIVDDVLYIHGEGYSGQNAHVKAASAHRRSTVIGHIHSYGGVQYMAGASNRIFAMNAGCLIDVKAYAFRYARKMAVKPTIGCGIVLGGEIAHFIPMLENR